MDLVTLSEKAMSLRRRFDDAAKKAGTRPWTREEVMQGFVGDVGDLTKLVMAKSGIREIGEADTKLAHELADCLWSVLVLANLYGVDLEKEFFNMIETVTQKLEAGRNR